MGNTKSRLPVAPVELLTASSVVEIIERKKREDEIEYSRTLKKAIRYFDDLIRVRTRFPFQNVISYHNFGIQPDFCDQFLHDLTVSYESRGFIARFKKNSSYPNSFEYFLDFKEDVKGMEKLPVPPSAPPSYAL